MRDRWSDGVMVVTEMGTVWRGGDVVCDWNRIGLVPCGRLEQSNAGELDDLGLEQVLKDRGLRPVAQTRTKTGLT